jgi:hypothetical protein
MRVRILTPAEGIMDGVSLAHLIPDTTYDLEPAIADYLIESRHAELVPSSALVIPLDNPRAYSQLMRGVTVIPPLAEAADKPPPADAARKSGNKRGRPSRRVVPNHQKQNEVQRGKRGQQRKDQRKREDAGDCEQLHVRDAGRG